MTYEGENLKREMEEESLEYSIGEYSEERYGISEDNDWDNSGLSYLKDDFEEMYENNLSNLDERVEAHKESLLEQLTYEIQDYNDKLDLIKLVIRELGDGDFCIEAEQVNDLAFACSNRNQTHLSKAKEIDIQLGNCFIDNIHKEYGGLLEEKNELLKYTNETIDKLSEMKWKFLDREVASNDLNLAY